MMQRVSSKRASDKKLSYVIKKLDHSKRTKTDGYLFSNYKQLTPLKASFDSLLLFKLLPIK